MGIFGKKTKTQETNQTATTETTPVEINSPRGVNVAKPNTKREHLFGTLLIGVLIIVVCFGLFGVGFGAFTLWQKQSLQNEAPSISGLASIPSEKETETVTQEIEEVISPETETQEKQTEEGLKAAQALDVIVMNGGGAKGVATEAANLLKKEGFTKVTVGNTKGDFTGTTLYNKKGFTKEAEALKAKIITQYPSVTIKEALVSDVETQTASLTLIFGK